MKNKKNKIKQRKEETEEDKKTDEEWETLCQHIEDLGSIEEYICNEKRVEV